MKYIIDHLLALVTQTEKYSNEYHEVTQWLMIWAKSPMCTDIHAERAVLYYNMYCIRLILIHDNVQHCLLGKQM